MLKYHKKRVLTMSSKSLLLNFSRYPLWYLIKYIGFFVCCWLFVGSFFSELNPSIYPIGIVLGVVAYRYPRESLYIFMFFLPLFGSRPPDPQTHYLIVLSSFLIGGLYLGVLSGARIDRARFIAAFSNRDITLLFLFLWFFVSLLSLVGLPILGALKHSLEEHWYYVFEQALIVGELTLFSSFSSVAYSIQAMMVGAFVYGYAKLLDEKMRFFKYLLLSILAGLLFAIVAGQLDYFGLVSLDWTIRGVPDTINLSGGRLSSFFYNSSWFSQYLAILLPLIPVLLLVDVRRNYLKLGLLVLIIIVGEVTLILAMQRGAWITYPPTLFLIWVSIYYAIAKVKEPDIELKSFFRKNWLKVLVTIPLTVSLSVFIVYGIKDYRKNQGITAVDTFEATTQRAGRIAEGNDRLAHWPPAMQFFKENPIFGGGGDSFGWQYKIYYFEDGAKYKGTSSDTLKPGQFGTSHNMYLQSLTGRGIFGLVALLGFLLTLVYRLVKYEVDGSANRLDSSIIGLSILGSLIASMIYGNVQEIFYSQSVQIPFWVIVFLGISLVEKRNFTAIDRQHFRNSLKYIIILMLGLLPIHVLNISYIKEFISVKLTHFLPW